MPRGESLCAMRSAAELLGAHARIRAFGSRSRSWLIASTIVTVLPVPGLHVMLSDQRKGTKRSVTYGPNTTNGALPAGRLIMLATASR